MSQNTRILLVGDGPHLLRATSRLLKRAGYEVIEAETGTEGLRLAMEQRPDLILLDVVLPDMDGIEVCRRVKSELPPTESFVILMSNVKVLPDDKADGLETGADGYIARPIANRELLARVEAMLRIKRTEETLRESEEKYKLVSENIPVVVYSALPDERSTNIFISGRAEELTGCPVEKFMEEPELWASIVHPEDSAFVWESINNHRRDKTTLDIEYRIISRDGISKWIRDKAEPALDENGEIVRIDGFMEDITERKRAEDALRESEERYRSLFEETPVGLYRTTPDGRIIDANPALLKMLGYPDRASYLATNAVDLYVDPEDRRRGLKVLEEADGWKSVRLKLRRRDGRVIWVLDSGRVIRDDEGRILYYSGALEDITERVRAEEALRESEARWRSLTETSPDHILTLDADLNIQFVNFAAPGLTVEELIGTPLYAYVEGERQVEIKAVLEGVLRTGYDAS